MSNEIVGCRAIYTGPEAIREMAAKVVDEIEQILVRLAAEATTEADRAAFLVWAGDMRDAAADIRAMPLP